MCPTQECGPWPAQCPTGNHALLRGHGGRAGDPDHGGVRVRLGGHLQHSHQLFRAHPADLGYKPHDQRCDKQLLGELPQSGWWSPGGLDLSAIVSSSNPPWPVSYGDLLMSQTQTVANGNTIVPTPPPCAAANANGGNSVKSLALFDLVKGDTILKGALAPD